MGTLHHLPTDEDARARMLQKLVIDAISQHPDAEIAQRWMSMAEKTIARYPGPPLPSQPVLDLSELEGLSAEQVEWVQTRCAHWLQGYFEDVREQLMGIHADFLKLQKTIAELQADQSDF